MEFFHLMVKHSQITSLIMKRLSARKTRTKSVDHILQTVRDIDEQLHDWHVSLPPYYKSDYASLTKELPDGVTQFHVNFVSLVYNSCLLVIHNIFCYPWIRLGPGNGSHPEALAQRRKSLDVVADAARNIIIIIQSAGKVPGSGFR